MWPPDLHQVRDLGNIRGWESHEPRKIGTLVRGRPNGRHGAHWDRGGTRIEHAASLYPGTPGGGPVRRRPPFNRRDGDSGMRRLSEKGAVRRPASLVARNPALRPSQRAFPLRMAPVAHALNDAL